MTVSNHHQQYLNSPVTIFTTIKKRDDFNSLDMLCGDLNETQLKSDFHLWRVSNKIDVYSLKRFPIQSNLLPVSRTEASSILFDEFREYSKRHSFFGPYKYLIEELITHMQTADGAKYKSSALDRAYKDLIESDKSDNSSLLMLKKELRKYIKGEIALTKTDFAESFSNIRLPMFTRWKDNFNGLGMSVHGVHFTEVIVKSIIKNGDNYKATISYRAQDHFGLDDDDILSKFFYQFRIFRIWFILQRYEKFRFKPFFTNMEASVEIKVDVL